MITKENWTSCIGQDLWDHGDVMTAGEEVNGEQIIVVESWRAVPKLASCLAGLFNGIAGKTDEFHHFIEVDIPPTLPGKTDDDALREYLSNLEDSREEHNGTKLLSPEMVEELVEHVSWKGELAQWADDKVIEILFGAEVGFSDEYEECSDCRKIIHYGAESYGDIGRFFRNPEDGTLTCRECINANPKPFLEYAAEADEPVHCPVDPREHGYVDVRAMYSVAKSWNKEEPYSFENGWYGGQIDNPTKQKKFLSRCFIRPVFFDVSPSQFSTSWNVLVHQNDQRLAEQVLFGAAGLVRFWEYKDVALVLFVDDESHDATIHIRWREVEDSEQQIEYLAPYSDELPDNPSVLLHRLTRDARRECQQNHSLTKEEDELLQELENGFATGDWPDVAPKEFFRDVHEKKDPKDVLAAGLKAAAAIPRATDPGVVRVIQVGDGTATATDLTREQFIEGVPRG